MLEIRNIHYAVGSKKILDEVSSTFEAGKLNFIIGPNGAGKSSLVKMICRQLTPDSGDILFEGKNINSISFQNLARRRAVLSQNIELAFPLLVHEVVMMGRYPHFEGKPSIKDKEACHAAMTYFDVDGLASRNYMTLSGGEKQRVHFARVFAQIWYPVDEGNRYLILDEPLASLDAHYQFDFLTKLKELIMPMNLLVVGVLHDLHLAARFGDHIVLLHEGQVMAAGEKEFVLSKENIRKAYHMDPLYHWEENELYLFLKPEEREEEA